MSILRKMSILLFLFPTANLHAEKTKIVIWHMWEKKIVEALKTEFRGFEKANPDIEVVFVRQDNLDAKVSLIGKGAIDVDLIGHPHDQIGKFALRGVIRPIDTVLSVNALRRISPSAIEGCRLNGKLYGMPIWSETVALIYNTRLVAKPPRDTKQLFAICENVKKKGIYPFVTIPFDPYFNSCWIFGYGCSYLDEKGEPAFNTQGFYDAVVLMRRLSTFYPKDIDYGIMLDLFNKGRAAMIISGPWSIGDIRASGVDYAIAPIPKISGIEKDPVPFMGIQVLTMSKFTKKSQAAARVMEYFSSVNVSVKLAVITGAVPVNRDALHDPAVQRNKDIIAFSAQIRSAVPMPTIPEMGIYWQPLKNALYKIIVLGEECEPCLSEATHIIKRELRQMRK